MSHPWYLRSAPGALWYRRGDAQFLTACPVLVASSMDGGRQGCRLGSFTLCTTTEPTNSPWRWHPGAVAMRFLGSLASSHSEAGTPLELLCMVLAVSPGLLVDWLSEVGCSDPALPHNRLTFSCGSTGCRRMVVQILLSHTTV